MFPPFNVTEIVRIEHEFRVREAQRFWQAEAASQAGHGRTTRISLRRRAGAALVILGERLQGATPAPAADRLGQIAG